MTNVEALKALYAALGGTPADVAGASTIVEVLNAIAAKYDGDNDATINPDAIANIAAVAGNLTPEPVLIEKSITANGDYSAASDNADGYSSVTVGVTPLVEAESEEPSEAQSGNYVWVGYSLTGSDVTLIIRVTQDDTPPSESGVNFVTFVIIN